MFAEFKKFAMRGNVMDMAVGIIIGAAFGLIIKSLVADVIMPPIGMAMGEVDFSDLSTELQAAVPAQEAVKADPSKGIEAVAAVKAKPAVAIRYGAFINTIINFLIVAFSIFMVVRFMNKFKKKEEEKPKDPPKQEVLLEEIRDLLKAQN